MPLMNHLAGKQMTHFSNRRPNLSPTGASRLPVQSGVRSDSQSASSNLTNASAVQPQQAESPVPLLRLYGFLQALGLRVNYRESSLSQPFEQVIVGLDPSEQEPLRPEYLLQIAFAEDIQAGLQGRKPNYSHGATLLFSIILPVQIQTEQCLDAYRLLAVLNRILPIGHLGLHEGLQPAQVFIKYPLAALNPNLSMNHVLSVIEQINAFVLLISPALQDFSRSKQSVDSAREVIESLLIKQARELYAALQTLPHSEQA